MTINDNFLSTVFLAISQAAVLRQKRDSGPNLQAELAAIAADAPGAGSPSLQQELSNLAADIQTGSNLEDGGGGGGVGGGVGI